MESLPVTANSKSELEILQAVARNLEHEATVFEAG